MCSIFFQSRIGTSCGYRCHAQHISNMGLLRFMCHFSRTHHMQSDGLCAIPLRPLHERPRQVQNSATQRRVSQCMQASTAPLAIGAGDKCLHVGMTTCRDSHVTRHGLRNNPPRFGCRPVGSELCHPAARVAISPPLLHTHPATHTVTTAREECPQVGMSTCCGSDVARHHARTHIARPCAVS